MRPQCCGREWDVKAKKDTATDPEGCMMRKAKANLARIVVYALEKENGWRSTHLFDCLDAGSLTVCYMGWRQRARGGRGEGEDQCINRIQGKQMEEIEIELQRDYSKAFCFLCSLK